MIAGVKPGWYVLVGLFLYSVVVTVVLLGRPAGAGPRQTAADGATSASQGSAGSGGVTPASGATSGRDAQSAYGPVGLWFPVPGARLPASDDNLPNAARPYRQGVSQGFDFYGDDSGIPIVMGTPVVASQAGQIVRADVAYTEMDPRAWEVLMADVARSGATDEQLDRLRGRQVWLRLEGGTVLRYGHLADVRDGIRTGTMVYRGQVIGFVGNSGTDVAVAGRSDQARLRFEVWTTGDTFFGAGMEPEAVRMAAASLFVGP